MGAPESAAVTRPRITAVPVEVACARVSRGNPRPPGGPCAITDVVNTKAVTAPSGRRRDIITVIMTGDGDKKMAGPGARSLCISHHRRGEAAARARHEPTRVGAGAAQIQTAHWRVVATIAEQRTHREELIERQLAMEDMPSVKAVV